MRRWVRSFGSRRGLAEIVGTLMLVLIVVSAAVAFSIFVAEYQKQVQAEQAFAHDQALEHLRVLHVVETLNGTTANFSRLNFTIVSQYVNPSDVTEIAINNFPVRIYDAVNLSSFGTPPPPFVVTPGVEYTIPPSGEAQVLLNLSDNATFYQRVVLSSVSYLKIDVFTALQNQFTKILVPPTAVALVDTLASTNGTGAPVLIHLLDGSESSQPSGNATLVVWSWAVTNVTSLAVLTFQGQKAELPTGLPSGTYSVSLTVENSDGLYGSTVPPITYVQG